MWEENDCGPYASTHDDAHVRLGPDLDCGIAGRMSMRVLMIGATGMLGRPVARQLASDGVAVRAMVRDVGRARSILAHDIEFVHGDLRDRESISRAIDGCDAIHLNLAAPMRRRPPRWCPEYDGTNAVLDVLRGRPIEQITRISAMGVEESAPDWWAAQHKSLADHALVASGRPFTIFRPTWLMESLALLLSGARLLTFNLRCKLRWLAGDDLARQVSAALRDEASIRRVYYPQGPEPLTMREAAERFSRAWPSHPAPRPVPIRLIRMASMFSGRAHYLSSLLRMTEQHCARLDRLAMPTDLPPATMTIEDYVAAAQRSGDIPRK